MLLDLAVFAPLGLLVSIGEAVPELTRKGRARFLPQVGLARTVGQFAVRQGYRRVVSPPKEANSAVFDDLLAAGEGLWRWVSGGLAGTPFGSAPGPAARHDEPGGARGPQPHAPRQAARPHDGGTAGPRREQANGAHGTAGARTSRGRAVPSVEELAIPSYDSLSAPQVVQRLAGLSWEEIEAVRRYEAATRGRRTILARAEQLLG